MKKSKRDVDVPHAQRHQARFAAATSIGAEQSVLRVTDYAHERLKEMTAISKEIKAFSGNRRVHQSLPHHLRRRAASYNIYRLPKKIQFAAKKQKSNDPGEDQKKPRSVRRRRMTPLNDHQNRARKNRWLETHIWHAKRMHMKNIWGYRLGMRTVDKGYRWSIKSTAHGCTLYDASYMRCLEFAGGAADIIALLRPFVFTRGDPMHSIASKIFSLGHRCGTAMLMNPNTQCSISEIDFLWEPKAFERPNEHRKLWLWVHPSAISEISDIFLQHPDSHKVSVRIVEDLNRFQLTGPKSHLILSSVIANTPVFSHPKLRSSPAAQNAHNVQQQMWTRISKLRTTASLPLGCVISLNIGDLRMFFPPKHRNNEPENNTGIIMQPIIDWPEEMGISPLWNDDLRKWMESPESEKAINQRKSELVQPDAPPPAELSPESPPTPSILLLQRVQERKSHVEGFLSGWTIIVPKGWGLIVWRSLVFAGGRAVGYEQYVRQNGECYVPSFPQDYPDAKAYDTMIKEKETELTQQYKKRPPSKRPNFLKLRTFSPFTPNWTSLLSANDDDNDMHIDTPILVLRDRIRILSYFRKEIAESSRYLVRVDVTMISKGCPHSNAAIYEPNEEDLANIYNGEQYYQGFEEKVGKKSDHVATRKLIGYVTTPMFCFKKGKGAAIGFCSLEALIKAPQQYKRGEGKFIVLMRNASSQFYRPAFARISEIP